MNEELSFHLDKKTLAILNASNEMDSTLLITGSTGTGKSHLAFTIHKASQKRNAQRWSKVNLATLSENLIESELFGHERGSFTGADSRRTGRLESCNGGTVFLDEIGELPLRLQSKLLDFIQYKKISPVGSNRDIDLNVRIIAATNKNLQKAVELGTFREDLYHRLNVFHVSLKNIHEEPQVVRNFSRQFLQSKSVIAKKFIRDFSEEVKKILAQYFWPGNLRELENVIEFAVALEQKDLIQVSSLPEHLQSFAREHFILPSAPLQERELTGAHIELSDDQEKITFPMSFNYHDSKDAFEKAYIEAALRRFRGKINLTSRGIGLNKVSLTEKIKKLDIDWKKIKGDRSTLDLAT